MVTGSTNMMVQQILAGCMDSVLYSQTDTSYWFCTILLLREKSNTMQGNMFYWESLDKDGSVKTCS